MPETRGRQRSGFHGQVKVYYFEKLYQLYHIQRLLELPGNTPTAKVKEASLRYGISVKTIRELWCLDQNDQPTSRPTSLKEMARRLTARAFRVTEQTVSNILAL
jgi:hypothetical protein